MDRKTNSSIRTPQPIFYENRTTFPLHHIHTHTHAQCIFIMYTKTRMFLFFFVLSSSTADGSKSHSPLDSSVAISFICLPWATHRTSVRRRPRNKLRHTGQESSQHNARIIQPDRQFSPIRFSRICTYIIVPTAPCTALFTREYNSSVCIRTCIYRYACSCILCMYTFYMRMRVFCICLFVCFPFSFFFLFCRPFCIYIRVLYALLAIHTHTYKYKCIYNTLVCVYVCL